MYSSIIKTIACLILFIIATVQTITQPPSIEIVALTGQLGKILGALFIG